MSGLAPDSLPIPGAEADIDSRTDTPETHARTGSLSGGIIIIIREFHRCEKPETGTEWNGTRIFVTLLVASACAPDGAVPSGTAGASAGACSHAAPRGRIGRRPGGRR